MASPPTKKRKRAESLPVEAGANLLELFTSSFAAFRELRDAALFCDVALKCVGSDTPIKCHRVVLAAMSPYFKNMFSSGFVEGTQDIVKLEEEYITVLDLVDFAYGGGIHPESLERAIGLAMLSDKYQCSLIADACLNWIRENALSNDTCVRLLAVTEVLSAVESARTLRKEALLKTQLALDKIPLDKLVSEVSHRSMVAVLQGDRLQCKDEGAVLLLVCEWILSNDASPAEQKELLDCVRLIHVPDIEAILEKHDFLATPPQSTMLISNRTSSTLMRTFGIGFRSRESFPSEKLYGEYIEKILVPGMRVRCRTNFERIKAGDVGVYRRCNTGTPPCQCRWENYGDTYWVNWSNIDIIDGGQPIDPNSDEEFD